MTDLSLYNIAEEQEAITALLEMDGGEITEDHDALIEQVEQMIAHKTDRVVGFYNFLTDEIDNAKKRKDEIATFIKVREVAQERLKDYVGSCMEKLKAEAFHGKFYEIKERRPSKVLHINHEDLVPPEFTTVGAPRKTQIGQSVEIRPRERMAITLEENFAFMEATK